ncbi:MAG: T9SS type A sorting domain-containing protein [Bacteroidales bacterium]|jgi:lysyl endopeptidase|nr:T9SS type A sorting domain-containing protein [Bacteroidales bacterium]
MRFLFSLFLSSFFSLFSFAQGHSFNTNYTSIFGPFISFDKPSQDSIENYINTTQAYVFAYPIAVSMPYTEYAQQIKYDSVFIYNMQISAAQARSLNIIFSDFFLPEGATVSVFSRDSSDFFGPYTSEFNNPSNVLATPIVNDSVLYISCIVPVSQIDSLQLHISQISYGFRDFSGQLKSREAIKDDAGWCNVNINCSEGASWQKEKRAVTRMIITGTKACTGSLLNNTLQDKTPYVITANHCVSKESEANTSVFYFGYEFPQCDNTGGINTSKVVSGAHFRATHPDDKIDFSLVEMYNPPPDSFEPYYLGWDVTDEASNGSVAIHHPRGDAMKISIDNQYSNTASFYTYKLNTHWQIADWEIGTTEAGSSGCPLFTSDHKVYGTLSGGEASCDDPINDYFSKLSSAYYSAGDSSTQLQYWLDPANYGAETCPGFDPINLFPGSLSHISPSDSVTVWNFGNQADGLFGGSNEIGWSVAAEEFLYNTEKFIVAITYAIDILPCADISNVELCVWTGGLQPDSLVYSSQLSDVMLIDSSFVFLLPDEPIETTGNFWVGYRFFENAPCMSFLLAQNRTVTSHSLLLEYGSPWMYASDISANTSLALEVNVTSQPDTLSYPLFFQYPHFSDRISFRPEEFYSIELFGHDSVKGIFDTTEFVHVSTKENVPDWGKADFLNASCISNEYSIKRTAYIRGLKFAIKNNGSPNSYFRYAVWDSKNILLSYDSILCSRLSEDYFNQVHFSAPVFVQDTFYAGMCYDNLDTSSVSLYQYYDNDFFVDAYYSSDSIWLSYSDFDIPYNFGIQPISCFSEYHFNSDKDSVLKYVLPTYANYEFISKNDWIIFPSFCKNECYIQWKHAFYETAEMMLFNNMGVCVRQQNIYFKNGSYPIDVSDLPPGVYIVQLKVNDDVSRQKIIVYW